MTIHVSNGELLLQKTKMGKFKLKDFLNRWLPPALWAFVIFALSSIEQIATSQIFVWDFFFKKFAHLGEFAVLFFLVFRASYGNWILSFLLAIIYAATDEFHQSFVPGRTASIIDLGIDLSGANIAAYSLWRLKQAHPKKLKKLREN